MFSSTTVAYVSRQIQSTQNATGRTLVVISVPRLTNAQLPGVLDEDAQRILEQHGAGAVLYIDRDDRRDALVARPLQWFSPNAIDAIRAAMERDFRAGRYDLGMKNAVAAILAVYAARARATDGAENAAPYFGGYGWLATALLLYLAARGAVRRPLRPRH